MTSPTHWTPSASIETLRLRADFIRSIRDWFRVQQVLEVETPSMSLAANTEPQIESFGVSARPLRYLRTSAEFHLKRLLAAGCGDVYELGKVFRLDESGRHHNPEFTMLEWYRTGLTHLQLIDDVECLLRHLHGDSFPGFHRVDYRALWRQQSGLDVAERNCASLLTFLQQQTGEVPASIHNNFDQLLDLGMGTVIGDSLAAQRYTCIYNYPASQASLARIATDADGWQHACRFEVYYGALELANGYLELTDADEQLRRFEADNAARADNDQRQLPVDRNLIEALASGMPDCAGVAIGVDRLLMVLMPGVDAIEKVMSFDWQRA